MKPEVLKSWSLEIDYSRAPCLGADQKARGLWEGAIWGIHSLTLIISWQITTEAPPQAGTGLKMQTVRFFNVTLSGIYR